MASIDGETGDDVTFDYDRAGRVSTIYQGARHADVLRDELGRVTSLEMDDNELFSIDYSPMQIDAVIAADVKSNRVRVDSPMVSHVFGSLEHIAWARARGSVHGLIRFEPGMARFIITDEPYLAPDAATYSSLKRRSVPLRADEERFDVLAFDKPSNSLFIPPEYYSVNCTICVASVSSAEMTANGQSGPVTVTVGENVDFEVTASGSCMDWPMFPLPGEPEPIDFFHNIFYGDGGSTFKLSFFWPNTQFSHSFASPGTYNSVDNISCGCNSLLTLSTASATVEAKCGIQNRSSHSIDGCSIPAQVTAATAVLWGGSRNDPVNGDEGLIDTDFGVDQGTVARNAIHTISSLPCNQHDLCYQTCGSDRLTCDGALGDSARNICNVAYAPDPATVCPHLNNPITGPAQCLDWAAERVRCPTVASAVEAAVAAAGAPAFDQRQVQYCSCGAP